ncbi:hypothetical protein ACUJ8H_41610, partial [Streptomyces sp. EKR5.2]|uniref:hypothetical protein n=1 Tax=Streptomyces sp. EKR5.2 TaxID=3461014 RepID=UPI00404306E5
PQADGHGLGPIPSTVRSGLAARIRAGPSPATALLSLGPQDDTPVRAPAHGALPMDVAGADQARRRAIA